MDTHSVEVRRSVGRRMRRIRQRSGLSLQRVADGVGVHRSTVCRWESGLSSMTLSELPSVADAFGMDVDGLVSELFRGGR